MDYRGFKLAKPEREKRPKKGLRRRRSRAEKARSTRIKKAKQMATAEHVAAAEMKTPWLKIYPNGREVIDYRQPEGAAEYWNRKVEMAQRQGWECGCGCGTRLRFSVTELGIETNITFEHQNGRGAGKRDDRTKLPDGTWINAAYTALCNQLKGSRRIPYAPHAIGAKPAGERP
jgi:hypothetical protein